MGTTQSRRAVGSGRLTAIKDDADISIAKTQLRLPENMYRHVGAFAALEGVSKNTFIVDLIAEGIARRANGASHDLGSSAIQAADDWLTDPTEPSPTDRNTNHEQGVRNAARAG